MNGFSVLRSRQIGFAPRPRLATPCGIADRHLRLRTEVAHNPARRTLMNIALWIIAGLLAVAFLAIGALEVLAAVGLILPAALDIAPVLAPLAAVGLVLLMVGAFIAHVRRREAQAIVVTLVLLALAAFVAWGRFGPQSFTG